MSASESRRKSREQHQPELEALGKRAAAIRQAKGLSQMQLADRSNLDFSHISRIERAASNPNWITLVKLAYGLDIPVTELVDIGSDELPKPIRGKARNDLDNSIEAQILGELKQLRDEIRSDFAQLDDRVTSLEKRT